MNFLTPSTRLSLGLAALTITVLCAAQSLGVLPDPRMQALEQRTRLAETIGIAVSQSAGRDDVEEIRNYLEAIITRHPDLLSGAVLQFAPPSGQDQVVTESGLHTDNWVSVDAETLQENAVEETQTADTQIEDTQITVPIYAGNEEWGEVQLRFVPPMSSLLGFPVPPLVRTIVFISAAAFLVHFIFLRRMLQYLDPSQAVPERVRNTLNTLAEGLVVLDAKGRVVLANRSFAAIFDVAPETFQGRLLSDLEWEAAGEKIGAEALPWTSSLATNEPVLSTTLQLPTGRSNETITLLVNSTPIDAEEGSGRGVIVSFDDITPLETKKRQLAEMLHTVRSSTEEIRRQNQELERLATHDSLTGCVNRRRLFQIFETEWKSAARHGHGLACAMVDVDHFKSVNDEHGHVVGDQVLVRVATALREAARDADIVARYGGEEFCVLLPYTDMESAAAAGERFRQAVASLEFPQLNVTVSVGVSDRSLGAADPQLLIDQADRALYAAKRGGRNRVVRADIVPTDLVVDSKPTNVVKTESSASQNIPFHAVTALISALAYRDQETAAHARRVADLAIAAAEGLLGVTDCYTLEIAALLHDLGKIGVPDHILLKPGKLTDEEWAIMRRHERIGVEIVRASFAFEPLTQIISQYRTPFSTGGTNLSLGARFLAIADAYDAMVTDRPYRKGRSRDEAFAELRRCSSSEHEHAQFDPELVERFIATIRHGRAVGDASITVAKETALSIGLQIEHLAAALDDQDLDRLGALATRLRQVAERYGVNVIADGADGLARAVSDDNDLISVLQSANDLLRLCRSTQKSYIEQDDIGEEDLADVLSPPAVLEPASS